MIRIEAINRGPEAAELHLLPTLWFRNTWSWNAEPQRPWLRRGEPVEGVVPIELYHAYYGKRWLYCEGNPEPLFTENETNNRRLFGADNASSHVKDGINDYVVHGAMEAVNVAGSGTKVASHYRMKIGPGQSTVLKLRLTDIEMASAGTRPFSASFDTTFADRRKEADEFYATVTPPSLTSDAKNVMRQAVAGMLWSKQFYHYVVKQWLEGDLGNPPPPQERKNGRNHEWTHMHNGDVISMPDKWEYPWYAAWDLAFHCIPLALVDPDFAKEQLTLMLREWYMHPNGQIPAYEWAFRRREPAGARLGGVASVQGREEASRQR